MSVQSQISRISNAVSDAFSALTQKGVSVPSGTKVDGLARLISTIKTGITPTQFTNLYDPANVQVKTQFAASSSIGYQYNADNQCNCITIPFHHIKGEPVVLRMRGIGTVRDRFSSATFEADGTTKVNHYNFNNSSSTQFEMSYDEYGDAMITFKGVLLSVEWYYFVFNFQYVGVNTNATAVTGPIVTINEPIGNGGYVG